MKKAASKKSNRPLKVRSTDDGLHLDGSILWFDSRANGELSFLSSAAQAKQSTKVPQVIATEETVKILEARHKRPNALVCQYNRPFSIGKLKMELLPSGSILGGASLYVESDKGRILYAPHLQTQKLSTARQMQLKKAQTLVIGAYHPNPNAVMPNRKREKERLLKAIKQLLEKNEYPIIVCQSLSTAQELTKILTSHDIPLAVHSSIYRINRVYEAYGSHLGRYTLYSPRYTKNKVLMFPYPDSQKQTPRRPLPDGPVLYVEDTLDDSHDVVGFRGVEDHFYISATCDGKDLREVIATVAPKEVYVFGPYAKAYCHELKNTCKQVRALYSNDQPTLF